MVEKVTNEKGFTLLELTIILVVVGLIATPFIQEYRNFAQTAALSATNNHFFTVESAIQAYYERNGYLPCPAESFESKSFDAGTGTYTYSGASSTKNIHADADDFGIQDCSDFEPELNNPDRTVLIGAVPTKTLGLNADQALDGWGNKIAYVVSKYMLNIAEYDAEFGTTINDGLDVGIEFFSRDTSGIPTCNNFPIGGFQEKYIIRERVYEAALLMGNPDGIAPNTQRPSDLITSTGANDVAIINSDPISMAKDLCKDDDSDGNFDQITDTTAYDIDLETANHVLLVSYGPTGNGGFNGFGAAAGGCVSTAHDGINCYRGSDEENSIFYTNGEDFDSGGVGVDFYDDMTYALRADTFKLFTNSRPDDPTSNDSYSPYEIIGIATDDPMGGADPIENVSGEKQSGIDVGGNIRVESNASGDGRAMASTICNEQGALPDGSGACFTPSIIAGSGVGCDSSNTAVSGISNNNADCFQYTPFAASSPCGANELMVGVNADGTVICEVPPFP